MPNRRQSAHMEWMMTITPEYTNRTVGELAADQLTGDMFWDHENPENGCTDPADLKHDYGYGEIIRVNRAVRLTDVFVVCLPPKENSPDDNDREFIGHTAEEAERWIAEQGL